MTLSEQHAPGMRPERQRIGYGPAVEAAKGRTERDARGSLARVDENARTGSAAAVARAERERRPPRAGGGQSSPWWAAPRLSWPAPISMKTRGIYSLDGGRFHLLWGRS